MSIFWSELKRWLGGAWSVRDIISHTFLGSIGLEHVVFHLA